jgi:hypothetical protein
MKWRPLNKTEKLRIMELAGLTVGNNGTFPHHVFLNGKEVGTTNKDGIGKQTINEVWDKHFRTEEESYIRPLLCSIILSVGFFHFFKPYTDNWLLVPIGTALIGCGVSKLLELFLRSR